MSKSAARAAVTQTVPATESGTVVQFPVRQKQTEAASTQPRRQYLTEREVDLLCDAARKRGRYGQRDATMILIAYRHGLRVSELVALCWDQVDLEAGRLQVVRRKGSDDSIQPLSGVEIRALRKLRRDGGTNSAALRRARVRVAGAGNPVRCPAPAEPGRSRQIRSGHGTSDRGDPRRWHHVA